MKRLLPYMFVSLAIAVAFVGYLLEVDAEGQARWSWQFALLQAVGVAGPLSLLIVGPSIFLAERDK